jgi:GPH family glycoside/pentoside/hexuronide:cation symporter
MGGLATYFGTYTVQTFAIPVYQMTLGVNPAYLGAALAVPRLWDALIDPVVGNFSDNFRSRFGRRKPFIICGALLMGLAYGMIWMVSPAWTEPVKLAYFILTALAFYTCYAFFSVPYQSLTYEASPDYDERTRVMAHYSVWYKLGDLSYGWIFPLSQIAFFASPIIGIRSVGWLIGILVLGGAGMVPGFFARERYYQAVCRQPQVPFWGAVRDALTHRGLLLLIALTMLKLVPSMLASSMDYYLLVYYMNHGDIAVGSFWKGILASAYGVVGLASIPVLEWLSNRHGKKWAMCSVYGLVVFAGIAKWFIFVPGHKWLVLLDPLLSAPIWTGISMLIPSMLADVCDDDELRHGQRREGTFGAIYSWIVKSSVSVAFLGTGIMLNVVRFHSTLGGNQSAHTFFWMRFSFAGVTTVSAIMGVVVAMFYPITKTRAEQTRALLEARRGQV